MPSSYFYWWAAGVLACPEIDSRSGLNFRRRRKRKPDTHSETGCLAAYGDESNLFLL